LTRLNAAFKFLRPIKVAFRDIDGMRHVNHAEYLTYCETARNEYWIAVTGIKGVDEYDFVLVELTARYLKPALLGDELVVGVRVSEMRRSSFIMEHEIRNVKTGELVCEVRSVQVMYDTKAEKSMPISDLRRDQIERFEERSLAVP